MISNHSSSERVPFLRPQLVASWREIALVLLILFVPFIAGSARAAAHGSQTHYFKALLTDHMLLLNGAVEAALLGLGLIYFHRRGWTPADLRIRPGIGSTLQGFALGPLALIANGVVVYCLLGLFFFSQHRYHSFLAYILANNSQVRGLHLEVSWSVLLVGMILNAYLEEIVCTAYAFNQFASKLGPWPGLFLIVALRAACHSYQGLIHALGIAAAFLVFTLWYWRTRNLWTLIFAHALIDICSVSVHKIISH